MPISLESKGRYPLVREVYFKAAGNIQPGSPAYEATQRVLNMWEAEAQRKLGEFDGKAYQQDLNTMFMASGLKIEELIESMRKSGLEVVITRKNKTR